MSRAGVLAATALALVGGAARAPAAARQEASPSPAESFEQGRHWRIGTAAGVVHVWVPEAYGPGHAGTVVYVHGYYASADTAWDDDRLAAQFRESGRNAVFVVPEAPSSGQDPVLWPSLTSLLATVRSETGLTLPSGPLVVVGHSGAWRTVEPWLHEARLAHVILLDAVYGEVAPYRAWLRRTRSRRAQLVVVADDTMGKALRLVRGLHGVVRLPDVPASAGGFSTRSRAARVLLLRSQYEHQAIVTEGKVIPVVLELTSLAGRGGEAGGAKAGDPARKPLR